MYFRYHQYNNRPKPVYYADKKVRDFYEWLINNQKLATKESHQFVRAIKGIESFTYAQGFSSKKLFSLDQDEIFATVGELLINDAFNNKYLPKYRNYPINPASAISKYVEYVVDVLTPGDRDDKKFSGPSDSIDSLARHPVNINDVLVRNYSFRCSKHQTTDYAGEVQVLTGEGTIKGYLVRIWYCEDCNCYYILNKTFQDLKKKGVILCRVMEFETYKLISNNPRWYNSPFFKWRKVSPLRLCGYCVNQNENLTDKQRHRILEEIVDNGILPIDRVMSYLSFFKDKIGSGQSAKEKWQADYDYISNYKLGTAKRVVIPGFSIL